MGAVRGVLAFQPSRINVCQTSHQAEDSKANEEVVLPALDEPLDERWTTIEGNFLLFWAVQTTHAYV